MKVYRKHLREISVDNNTFKYSVIENSELMKLRCYSTKSSYLEVSLPWGKLTHDINLYRPKVISLFIEYAINKGWNYALDKQTFIISANDSENIVKELGIDLLPYV